MDSQGPHSKEDVPQKIHKSLEDASVERVVLAGKAGIGKTWVANEVCKLATEQGSCYLALWLHLNKKLDERSLYMDIAAQLSLFREYEETEDDDGMNKEDEEEKWEESMAKIRKELEYKRKQAEHKNSAEGNKKSASSGGENDKGGKTSAEGKKSAPSVAEKRTAKGEKNLAEGDNKSASSPPNKYLLLILNDEGNVTEEDEVMTNLKLREFLEPYGPLKILITRRKEDDSSRNDQGEIEPSTENNSREVESPTENNSGEIEDATENNSEETESESPAENNSGEIEAATENNAGKTESRADNNSQASPKHVTKDETQALLDSLTEEKMIALFRRLIKEEPRNLLKKTLGGDDSTTESRIARMSLHLPAAVVVLVESLNCISLNRTEPEEMSEYVKKVFEEVVPSESHDAAAGSQSNINPVNCLLHLGYELLKRDDKLKSATVDCFWHSLDFFKHSGCVYYRDLIMHWILEGYFDPVRSVKEAYQDGHSVLMELINRGILKIQENNVVVPEVAMSYLIDLRYRGFFGTSRLGFSRVYGGDKRKGLGRVTVVDDMAKTVQTNKEKKNISTKRENLSTILVSGDRLRQETPEKFFKNHEMKDLEVLGLFNPTFNSLVMSLSENLKKLRFLVIRDYDLLDKIDSLASLNGLQVLEVSGASSLKNIPDDFFERMSHLESLNLSGIRIKSSPSSISKLAELRCLIVRDCPELEDLPDVLLLKKLEVIDFRGARELKTCFDKDKGGDKEEGQDRAKDKGQDGDKSKDVKKNKSKNKNFYHLTQLQLLDLSESQIERLPMFQDSAEAKPLSSLTRLLLHDCRNLRRLPNLRPLSGLQVLDLSGTSSLVEMLEVCFEEKKELRILNLSGTNLSELPTTISELPNLTQFFLKDCPNLEALPNIEKLTRLEVFDVSGCTKLEKIEGSFKRMSFLRKLNLCGTRIKTIPELPVYSSLCCSKYIVLPDSRREEGEDWSKIKERLPSGTSESSRSSDAGAETSEISEEESGLGDTHSNEPHSSVCPEKKGERKELVYHGNRYEALQKNIRQFVDPESPLKIEEITSRSDPIGFSDNDRERISKAEFVSLVDNFSTSVSSVFDAFQMTSVKRCWVNRCKKMGNLFSGESEKHVESLETLWVSNLPSLKSLCSGSPEHGGFKNLKKLSIDCCPNIETLFPASQLPTSLEELHIKFCEKLEKVFDQDGVVPNLKTLHLLELPVLLSVRAKLPSLITFTKEKCPKLKAEKEDLKQGNTSEETSQGAPHENSDSIRIG